MDKDIRILEDLRKHIERGRYNFRKSPKDRINEPYILARLDALEELINRYTAKNEELIATYNEQDLDANAYMKNEVFDATHETYLLYKAELKTALQSFRPSKSSCSDSSAPTKESVVRLPKISIPVFSGLYSEWSSFKDLFVSLVHNNAALDDVQRLHYLKTQVRGEAEQLLKHIPITTANYKKCWDMLTQRYDNKRFMTNCILKRLFSQKSMTYESSQSLKSLVDTTSDCINELANLGIGIQTWDVIIIYVVSSKLDLETRKQWEISLGQNCEDLPRYAYFREFLESKFRALELVEPTKNNPRPNHHSTTKVMHVTSNTNTTSCPFCQDSHRLYSCGQFAKEDIAKRQEITKSLRLCFNCLGEGHTGRICRVTTKCRLCKGKHHTLLHGYSKAASSTVTTVTEMPKVENHCPGTSAMTPETTTIANHLATGKVYGQTLLATALIKAESSNGYPQTLRALLDQGSQASFISEAAVQLLRLKKVAALSCISGLGEGHSDLTSKYVVMVSIQSLHDPTFQLQVQAHVLNTVTSILPDKKFVLTSWTDLGHIKLADPQYNVPNKIDILLGSEVYSRVLKKGLIHSPSGSMIAQDTYLGWVLSGQVGDSCGDDQRCHNFVGSFHTKLQENELLKKFWELEAESKILQPKVLTPEELACEHHFAATTSRDEIGRYVVELPFYSNVDCNYGDTRAVAGKRLCSLEKRLSKSPKQKKNYAHKLQEILTSLDAAQWSYLQSTDNPADMVSRGISPIELLKNTLWKNGSEWPREESIPYGKPQSICNKTDLENKSVKVHAASVNPDHDEELSVRFSSLKKMVRVIAYCRRFLRLKEDHNLQTKSYLTALELKESLTCCLRQHQARSFPETIASLLKRKNISKRIKLSSFNPFINRDGILRFGSRIEKVDLPEYSKHPLIRASHFGRLWKAGIKSTKHHLRRVTGDSTLTYEELSTVLVQIEACLNSRPLSALSVDADDPMPWTPSNFLVGEPLVLASDHDFSQVSISPLRRWQLTQRMLQHFWKRWSQKYLVQFFQRHKWKTKSPELRIDDVVLVKEDNLPPAKWLCGRVVKVDSGKDGLNRVATLRSKKFADLTFYL